MPADIDIMTIAEEFEIIKTKWHHNRGDFIFARHLGINHDLEINDGSMLGDIPIYDYIEMRSMLKADGQVDIFVFRPISLNRLPEGHFLAGQRVKLIMESKN
jgi:hypothetical protein